MKDRRAPGDDGVMIEAIKAGGRCVYRLFTECLLRGITPELWHKAVIIVLHKKGGRTEKFWRDRHRDEDKPLKVEQRRTRGKNDRWAVEKKGR
ncbi:hypothetical protein HUJ04_011079 [Dendroctonus ponderosae]|nr:hypothetical protein HUJ04_011079 [Dendroctonus ponderosae]